MYFVQANCSPVLKSAVGADKLKQEITEVPHEVCTVYS